MANGWTPERRLRQAELIQRWKPWKSSTGPCSKEGKRAVVRNAQKHGMRSAEWNAERRAINEALRGMQECRKEINLTQMKMEKSNDDAQSHSVA